MGALTWRGWAALCLASGAVVAPLFLEVFSGGSTLRFAALPLRYAWAWWLARPVLARGWLGTRALAGGLFLFCALVTGATLADLLGWAVVHPGWFLTLEWWQRPLYPWVELLPRWRYRLRPGYLWITSAWNLVEAGVVAGLLWRWRPARATADPGSVPAPTGSAAHRSGSSPAPSDRREASRRGSARADEGAA